MCRLCSDPATRIADGKRRIVAVLDAELERVDQSPVSRLREDVRADLLQRRAAITDDSYRRAALASGQWTEITMAHDNEAQHERIRLEEFYGRWAEANKDVLIVAHHDLFREMVQRIGEMERRAVFINEGGDATNWLVENSLLLLMRNDQVSPEHRLEAARMLLEHFVGDTRSAKEAK